MPSCCIDFFCFIALLHTSLLLASSLLMFNDFISIWVTSQSFLCGRPLGCLSSTQCMVGFLGPASSFISNKCPWNLSRFQRSISLIELRPRCKRKSVVGMRFFKDTPRVYSRPLLDATIVPDLVQWVLKKVFSSEMVKSGFSVCVASKQNTLFLKNVP